MAAPKVVAGPVEDEDGFMLASTVRAKPVRTAAPVNSWKEPSQADRKAGNRFAGAHDQEESSWNRD